MQSIRLISALQTLAICTLLFVSACNANTNIEISSNGNISQPTKNPGDSVKHTLWKVKGEKNTLYLLGSIHMLRPEHYPLPNVYDDAFEDAEKTVFEIDDAILNPAAAAETVMAFAQLPSGRKLADLINAEDYAEIKTLANKYNVPMFIIDPVDPWFSSLTLMNMQYMNAGLSPEHGIDQHYMQRALDAGKPVLGLETIEEQFKMFDSLSMDIQTDMLIDTLKQEVDVKEFIDEIIIEWQEGDMAALQELLQEDFEEYNEMYDILLKDRNENWIKQFQPMLKDTDDYLIVVGAAHMLGEDGVVRLLEKQGYLVEQL